MSLKYGEAFNFEISKLEAFFYGVLFFAEKAASRFLLRFGYFCTSLSRGLKMLRILMNFKINYSTNQQGNPSTIQNILNYFQQLNL
jgi:hypothetical protein